MGGLRVLIVDDEEDLVSTMAERLELRGFEVETATSGTDALAHVGKSDFSVLLVDVKMPGVGGLELMAEINPQGASMVELNVLRSTHAEEVTRITFVSYDQV